MTVEVLTLEFLFGAGALLASHDVEPLPEPHDATPDPNPRDHIATGHLESAATTDSRGGAATAAGIGSPGPTQETGERWLR